MKNEYICDFGNCPIQLPSDEQFYLKYPKTIELGKIKRFCSRKHLIAYVGAELIKE